MLRPHLGVVCHKLRRRLAQLLMTTQNSWFSCPDQFLLCSYLAASPSYQLLRPKSWIHPQLLSLAHSHSVGKEILSASPSKHPQNLTTLTALALHITIALVQATRASFSNSSFRPPVISPGPLLVPGLFSTVRSMFAKGTITLRRKVPVLTAAPRHGQPQPPAPLPDPLYPHPMPTTLQPPKPLIRSRNASTSGPLHFVLAVPSAKNTSLTLRRLSNLCFKATLEGMSVTTHLE